jgi:hypothetical protein
MLHLPPRHHETRKHIYPHRITQFGLVQPKYVEFKFKLNQSITHHINKLRHKPLGFSISPMMSTLTTSNVQSLNFKSKTNLSTTKCPETKDKLKNDHIE